MIFASIRSEDIPFRAGQKVKVHHVTVNGEPGSIVTRDFHQANKANPILVAFRERGDTEHPDPWYSAVISLITFGGYTEWDDPRSYFHPLTLATEPQRRHAAHVLGRLTRLAKEPS